jgi:hypothetical protein
MAEYLAFNVNNNLPCRVEIKGGREGFGYTDVGYNLICLIRNLKLFAVRKSRYYYNLRFYIIDDKLIKGEEKDWTAIKDGIKGMIKKAKDKETRVIESSKSNNAAQPPEAEPDTTHYDQHTSNDQQEEKSASVGSMLTDEEVKEFEDSFKHLQLDSIAANDNSVNSSLTIGDSYFYVQLKPKGGDKWTIIVQQILPNDVYSPVYEIEETVWVNNTSLQSVKTLLQKTEAEIRGRITQNHDSISSDPPVSNSDSTSSSQLNPPVQSQPTASVLKLRVNNSPSETTLTEVINQTPSVNVNVNNTAIPVPTTLYKGENGRNYYKIQAPNTVSPFSNQSGQQLIQYDLTDGFATLEEALGAATLDARQRLNP